MRGDALVGALWRDCPLPVGAAQDLQPGQYLGPVIGLRRLAFDDRFRPVQVGGKFFGFQQDGLRGRAVEFLAADKVRRFVGVELDQEMAGRDGLLRQWQKVCDIGCYFLSDNEHGSSENDLSIQHVRPENISLRVLPEGG